MAQDGKIAFGFDGGVFGGAVDDIVQPPDFVESRNVRLSVTRGAPVKAPGITDIITLSTLGFRCAGVVPHAASGTALFAMDTPVRATATSTARVQRHDGRTLGFGVSRPLKITSAGGTMPGRSVCPPSIALTTDGGRWVAQIKQRTVRSGGTGTFDGDLGLYVSYTDAAGRVVIASRHVCDVETGQWAIMGTPSWASITAHGDGAIVWYRGWFATTVRPLYARTLTLSGAELTVGTQVTVASPSNQCHGPAVFSLGGSDAWVMVPTSSTVVRVLRMSSTLTTLGTLDQTPGTNLDNASCSLWVKSDSSTAVAALVSSSTKYTLLFNPDAMTLTESTAASGPSLHAMCAALYVSSDDGNADYYGVAYSAGNQALPSGSTTTTAFPKTRIDLKQVGGSTAANADIPHMRLAAAYAASDTTYRGPDVTGEIYGLNARSAYLALTPWYGPHSSETDPAYVTDPAMFIASVWVDDVAAVRVGWHARVAVDRIQSRVSALPDNLSIVPNGFAYAGASLQAVGTRFAVGYLERNEAANLNNESGLAGRYVEFDLGSHQPPVAAVGSALTLSGGSLPLYWDGVELSEQMPLVRPKAYASTTTSGTASAAVSYSFIAVVYWRDAGGALHRSAPSQPINISVASGGGFPDVLVTRPATLHDDGVCAAAICRLYAATTSGGSSVYRLAASSPAGSLSNGCWRFVSPNGALSTTASSPALYSDGSAGAEVPPEPMPPSQDVCVALDRVFVIDAESRSDVWYSKPLQPGVAPEFSGVFKVTLPAQAGALIALAEIGGQLVAIGDAGVATIYGDGPDSNGNGGFGPPRIISRQGGTSREAVGRYPGGVVYLGSDGRWQKLDSQGVASFVKAPQPSTPVRGWSLVGNGSELAFWLDGGAHVYNYELDRWHTWDWEPTVISGEGYELGVLAAENDTSSTAWMCRYATFESGLRGYYVSRMDGATAAYADQAYWQTGWLIPGGDQQLDVEWQQVVIHALWDGVHALRVEIDAEYGADTTFTTQTEIWTADQLIAIKDVESNRYTVGIDVVPRKARSLRLRITETGASGTAFRPVSCTVYFAVQSKQARRPLKPGGRR